MCEITVPEFKTPEFYEKIKVGKVNVDPMIKNDDKFNTFINTRE